MKPNSANNKGKTFRDKSKFDPKHKKPDGKKKFEGKRKQFEDKPKFDKKTKNFDEKPKFEGKRKIEAVDGDNPSKKLKAKERKPNFDMIQQAKQIWEKIRERDVSAEERKPGMQQLMELIKGKMVEIIYKHDCSRIIQTCIKFGSHEDRQKVFAELKPCIVDLAKSHYGHFLVMKLLKYLPQARTEVMTLLRGMMKPLLKHKEACGIVEYIFSELANRKQKADLLVEFYGPELALFKPETPQTLTQIMTTKNADQKRSILRHLRETLNVIVDKGAPIIRQSIVHNLLWEYFQNAEFSDQIDMMTNLREVLVEIAHTREGALVACRCVSIASPKDRKVIVKGLKGYVVRASQDEYGHLFILRILDCVDDTVLVTKSVLSEIEKKMDEVAFNKYGRLIFLHVLSPGNSSYFNKDTLNLLQPTLIPQKNEETGEVQMVPSSKKTTAARQAEYMAEVLSPLLELCLNKENVVKMLQDVQLSALLIELLATNPPAKVANAKESIEKLQDVTIEALLGDEPDLKEEIVPMRTLKKIIKTNSGFAQSFCDKLEDKGSWCVMNKGTGFAVLALIEQEATSKQTKKDLKPLLKKLKGHTDPPASIIAEKLRE